MYIMSNDGTCRINNNKKCIYSKLKSGYEKQKTEELLSESNKTYRLKSKQLTIAITFIFSIRIKKNTYTLKV